PGIITGDAGAQARLIQLARFTLKWYLAAGVVFSLVLGPIGYVFLLTRPADGVDWQGPWAAVVLSTGLTLAVMPALTILEGCRQVGFVESTRMFAGLAGVAAFSVAAHFGLELWAVPLMGLARVIVTAGSIVWRFPKLVELVPLHGADGDFNWRRDVLPMQW